MLTYTCACCQNTFLVHSIVGTICDVCKWEYDEAEEAGRTDAFGPNGCSVTEWWKRWVSSR